MATKRERHGVLIVDFRYMRIRCREKTNLKDTPANRKTLAKVMEKMEAEITLGIFDYKAYFPKSYKAEEMAKLSDRVEVCTSRKPTFAQFTQTWYDEKKIEWRPSYQEKIKIVIDNYLVPYFGTKAIHAIKKSDLLDFRSSLAKVRYGKNGQTSLSVARINQIMIPLRMILQEASDRHEFETPFKGIKNLKEQKPDVHPFTLDEVWLFLNNVRTDYKNYYTVRFFTGMRTSEIDGLTWENVDLDRREIRVRQAYVKGVMGKTKTQESNRDIAMSPWVYDALVAQKAVTFGRSKYVFCNRNGEPLDYHNVNNKVWYPTLRLLGLKPRNAYQTRHTAATLWLAAGEAPEWIARQMGHANTMMLFKVYSRYVPNATRRDGSAFEALIANSQLTQTIETGEN